MPGARDDLRPQPVPLTLRQARTIRQLSHGLRFDEIAAEAGISMQAAKDQAREARLKLVAKTNCHAVAIALRWGIID